MVDNRTDDHDSRLSDDCRIVLPHCVKEILARATKASRRRFSLLELLPPLARIAMTARLARHAQQLVVLQPESNTVMERTIRASEKAASGELINVEEDQAVRERNIISVSEAEKRAGNTAAAMTVNVARAVCRCLRGPEFAYGENCLLAEFHLQSIIETMARARGLESNEVNRAVQEHFQQTSTDMEKLFVYVDSSGERWEYANVGTSLKDRPWDKMLTAAGIASQRDAIREKWRRIHEVVRQTGGYFCPPTIFD